MRPLRTKTEPEKLLDTVTSPFEGVERGTLVKAGLIAGGVVVLTAGSAAISSLRRRLEGSR